MLKGFRDFVMRGNVIDLAVAFVIGGAFALVVGSFVNNILTPIIGSFFGSPDLGALFILLPGDAQLRYGAFLSSLLSFVIVAFAVYLSVVVPMNRMRKPTEATTKTCPFCASEIPLAATRCPLCTSQLGA